MRLVLAATAAAALLTASAANAVTFVNGSFEDGLADIGLFTTIPTDDTTSITGWRVLSDGVDYIGSLWEASDGSRSLDLSALSSGGVSQQITGFEVGKRYRITFDLSGNPDGGEGIRTLVMSATGGEAVLYEYVVGPENSAGNMLYQTLTYDFVASNTMQGVQFRSLENSSFGVVLDNVSISLIPEPATWGLMVVGFAMTGALVRRRARVRSALA